MSGNAAPDLRWSNRVRPLGNPAQKCPTEFLLFDFDSGKADLKPEHEHFLREIVAKTMHNTGDYRLHLAGRAASTGTGGEEVTRQRVESVMRFLTQLEVLPEQCTTQHFRARQPFGAQASPRSDVESPEDRSVELRIIVPVALRLALQDASLVPATRVLVDCIRQAMEPLALMAGRKLHIVHGRHDSEELGVVFDASHKAKWPPGPNDKLIFGNCDGSVFVNECAEVRVGTPFRLPPVTSHRLEPGKFDYLAPIEPVFQRHEPEFARFVANVAVHELGHVLGLDYDQHTSQPDNFMVTGLVTAMRRDRRTKADMRRILTARQTFSRGQIERIVCAMRTGHYTGGMQK